jgi:hypothetical protein
MPLKREFDREYVQQKLRTGAQQLVADRDALRQRELSGAARADADADVRDVVTVVQKPEPPYPHDPFQEPRIRWETTGTMPHGLPQQVVTCSQSEALRNKQSLRALLERRLRSAYRQALLAAQRMPQEEALRRALRLEVHVADVSLVFRGNGS